MAVKKKVAKKKVVRKKTAKKASKKFTKRDVDTIIQFLGMPDEELQKHLPNAETREYYNSRLSKEEVDARLVMLQRLIMRGLTIKDIANQMQCSVQLVHKMKADLKDRQISNMSATKWEGYIAETLAYYAELKAQCMLNSGSKSASATARNQALTIWLQVDRQEKDFLTRLGLFGSDAAHLAAMAQFMQPINPMADHDALAVEAIQIINEELRLLPAIDSTAEQVFDE